MRVRGTRTDAGADGVDQVRFTRLLAGTHRCPTGLVRHLRVTADALDGAVARLGPGAVAFQGLVLSTGDFLATWAVELAARRPAAGRDRAARRPAPRVVIAAAVRGALVIGVRVRGLLIDRRSPHPSGDHGRRSDRGPRRSSVGTLPTSPLPDVVAALRAAGCVFAEDEARLLLEAAPSDLAALVERRAAGEPLEHLLGWAEFCGLRITVGPGVFVPRRRTELLVDLAVPLLRPGGVVVELCCGAAAVATAVAIAVPGLDVHAADVDPAAVRCARRNLDPVGGHVHEGDLDDPLPGALRGRVEVLVANAPYVPSAAIALMPPEARDHEPAVALDGGADGLDVQRRVAAAAPRWLARGGSLVIETSVRQAPLTAAAMRAAGLVPRVERDDERDATAVVGVRP